MDHGRGFHFEHLASQEKFTRGSQGAGALAQRAFRCRRAPGLASLTAPVPEWLASR